MPSERPLLATRSALVFVAGFTALLAGTGLTPVALLIGAVLVGPAWTATVAVADIALSSSHPAEPPTHLRASSHPAEPPTDLRDRGELVTVRGYLGELRRYTWPGVRTAAVPALVGALELVAVEMLRARPDQMWLLAPVVVGAVASVAVVLASVFAFPLRIRHGLTGRALWPTSASMVAVVPLGVLAAGILAVLSGTELSASLLLLVLAPLALLDVVATASTTSRVHSLAAGREKDRRGIS